MPTSSTWPRTYLNWKRVLFLSLKCVYFMLVVKFSQKSLEMSAKSRLAQRQWQSVYGGPQSGGEALT
ncbi:uncharacterized protein LOC128252878 [Drosophila gunungcola]|uniref:uncharacterized protein LOC128252878 n=1 Tax=Drosophila gunungcola TaxID=103775 RepID=UPI0022E730B8|nr:uncharacterized protein LOC128252878 [Drosophila gunungcola]